MTIAPVTTKFRDAYEALVPRWMKGYLDADPETGIRPLKRIWRVGYSIATHLDWLVDWSVDGVRYGFPGAISPTFDRYIGQERGITRGFDEPDASYEARLRVWRDTMARKGNAWCLLEQLRAYFTGHSVALDLISNTGATAAIQYSLAADGTMTTGSVTWDWDGQGAALPSRFWVLLHVPAELVEICPTWGNGGWEATSVTSETIGSTAPYWMVQNVQAIVRDFKPASALCSHIILIFEDYETEWSAQQPDGTWNLLSHRNQYACYWKGNG